MILTDREIMLSLEQKQIIVEPLPGRDAFSSTSLDLTLDSRALEWRAAAGVPIRPGADGYSYASLQHLRSDVAISGYTLKPRSFLLAWTKERVHLPISSRLAARVEGKSSLARLGVGVHVTAPTIHAGFQGQIQLEMFNFGPHDIIPDAGIRICQIIFEQTIGTPDKAYTGIFAGQLSS